MNRRQFLGAVSAAGLTLAAADRLLAEDQAPATHSATSGGYKHRIQFGAWINDMRNVVLPRDQWPAMTLDQQTENDIIDCLTLGQQSGYTHMDVWGLFASQTYPLDIVSAFHDPQRRPRVDRIVKAARDRGIGISYGMGVYSWGFDAIIQHDPAVQGTNPHVMCGSSDASLEWQKKLIDAIVQELNVESFHMESADQGRCTCPKCAPMSDIEYHTKINIKVGDYIQQKYPGKIRSCTIQGWSTWGKDISEPDQQHLVELSKHIDVMFDQGHRRTYINPAKRKEFIARLSCDYGTSGGFWVYPPPRWNRLRWFFPYTHRTGAHIKELYEQGGRGVMYYQGPTINPGVEVNLAFGGKLMLDPHRELDDVLQEVLQDRYRPKNPAALQKLVQVFSMSEKAFFDHQQEKDVEKHDGMPIPGEQHLGPLFGTSPGGATYIDEPFLNADGRKAYKASLLAAYDLLQSCAADLDDGGRVARLNQCIVNAVSDIETLQLGKNETG